MTERDLEMRQELLDTVARIRPDIERAADEGDSLMTLPRSSVDLLTSSGLLQIKLPEVLGGREADLITQYEVIEAMAYADAAAGWCLMIGATSIAYPAVYLPDATVQEIFQGPRAPRAAIMIAPTGTARQSEGGYTLTGRWSFASGVRHSDWLSVGARVPDPQSDRPRQLMFTVPTSAARIHDNWNTIGLRGTGSCDVSLEEIFVPTSFTYDAMTGEPARGGPLYRLGLPAFVAYEHAAFAIGVARRALDALVALAPSKMRGIPPSPLVQRGSFLRDLGELDLRLRAARALVVERNQAAWAIVTAGGTPGLQLQAELRAAVTLATDVAVDVAAWAHRSAGSSAVYKPNVLERAVRDLFTATQHFVVSGTAYEIHGQALLGITDLNPLS